LDSVGLYIFYPKCLVTLFATSDDLHQKLVASRRHRWQSQWNN
jgi:hypothetical protein